MRSILASYSRLALMSDKVFYNTSGITLIFFFAERAIPAGLAAELAAGEPRVDWRQPRGPERCQQTPAASTLKLLLKAEQGGHFLRRWWVLPQTGWPPRTTREQRRPQGTPVTFMPVAMPWGECPRLGCGDGGPSGVAGGQAGRPAARRANESAARQPARQGL